LADVDYVTPLDMMAGRQKQIHAARESKLEQAREKRQLLHQQAPLLFTGNRRLTCPANRFAKKGTLLLCQEGDIWPSDWFVL
jgi:hypothetical protein